MTNIRKAESKDLIKILELNEESVHFLSPLTMEKLEHLVSQSELFEVVEVNGEVEAFVLTITEGKDYDSVNYLWFAEHYDRFLYIDRVVVSVKMHSQGLGGMLYQSVFKYARLNNMPFVTAEIDINPPNPGSLSFHEKFGFNEVGKQSVAGGKKIVSLQAVQLKKNSIYTNQFESNGDNPWEGGALSTRLPRGTDLGASLYVLKPGAKTGYYHFHHGNEEMLILIEGRPLLRTPEGERELEVGEVVHFKKGPEGAHQVINQSDEVVRLIMVSNQVSPDAVEYPDQGLLSVMARTNSQLGEPLWDIRKINSADEGE